MNVHMKKILCLALMLLLIGGAALAQAAGLWIPLDAQDTVDSSESAPQFPFLAETDELSVNVRADMSTKAKRVGKLQRGEQLSVTGAKINSAGEVWYAVEMADGTAGYIRSDLLVASEIMAASRMANPTPEPAAKAQLIGNKNSKKYHEPYCHTLPLEKNRVYFSSAAEAEKQGYVHCKNCD